MELRDDTPAPRAMLPVGSREPSAHVPNIAAGCGGGNAQSSGGPSRSSAVGCSGGHRDAGQETGKVPVCCTGEDNREVPFRTGLSVGTQAVRNDTETLSGASPSTNTRRAQESLMHGSCMVQ